MVFVKPPPNAPLPSAGSQLGQRASQAFQQSFQPAAQQEYQRGRIQDALSNLKNLPPDSSPQELLTGLISATAGIPGAERYVGPLFQTLIEQRNRQNVGSVPLTSGGIGAQGSAPSQANIPRGERQLAQGSIGSQGMGPSEQAKQFFPQNLGPNQAPGNIPQEATGGQIRPVWSGEQELNEAQNLYQSWLQAGITNRSLDDAIAIKERENRGNIAHNQRVESERQLRIAEQENYGNLAENQLIQLFPNATEEQKAIFRKKGEDIAGRGRSQADIQRTLAAEAKNFKNAVSNAQKVIHAPRIQDLLQSSTMGTTKTVKQAESDARSAVTPLIREGLYDTARGLLSEGGFYPEERENILFGEIKPQVKKQIDQIPEIKRPVKDKVTPALGPFGLQEKSIYTPKIVDNLKNNLLQLWGGEKINNDLNLVQMRKAYEDRGYDWRVFKQGLNDLFSEGQIEFNPDQQNAFNSYLSEPPLDNLGKILYKLDMRGR